MTTSLQQMMFALGRPLSPFYALAMTVRAGLYKAGLFKSERLPVPVICIGNLVMGGTGKTPMVIYLARHMQETGLRPAVVSRGYGGTAGGKVNIVSDGKRILLDVISSGDEPYLMAEALPGIPVLTGRSRAAAGREAVNQFGAEVIILDDGFQHLALQRDLDIVLFKADILLGTARVFPGGELREPLAALVRARAFVITGVDGDNRAQASRFRAFLEDEFPNKPVFLLEYQTRLLDEVGRLVEPGDIQGEGGLFGVSGLANPLSFQRCLKRMALPLTGFYGFADHHPYGDADLVKVADLALRAGASALVTTRKDLVKIRRLNCPLPLFCLDLRTRSDPEFNRFVSSFLA